MSDPINTDQCPKCGAPIVADAPQGLCPKCLLQGAALASDPELTARAASELPSRERVAAAFPQLEILELVGQGGMGFVFKARQPHLDRFVALKLLPESLAKDPRFAERFNREGRVLAKLNHPNIVAVYDFGQADGFFFLMMEFVDGVNLRQAMEAGRFSPGEALAIVPKICEALQYAHGQGVLHRDIKPANILLDAHGRVKIADFGIAKLVGEEKHDITLTATGAALGTPHYMAPEQLEAPSQVDHRADIYSLGVVFYEMLTGELPIGRFSPPSSKTPVGVNVDEVVFRTLEKDRERRYQSAGEMKTQVEHLGSGRADSGAASGNRHWSRWSIYAAGAVGLSLPIPLLILTVLLLGHATRIGPGEVLLVLGSVAIPGLGGTLLGWRGLHEIRDSHGSKRGLPLALFATLTWPLLLLGLFALAMPLLLMRPTNDSPLIKLIGRFLFLLLSAGLVTLVSWTIYITGRWASGRPAAPQRRVLTWVAVGLIAGLVGTLLALRPRGPWSTLPSNEVAEQPPELNTPVPLLPVRANFRAAKGQVVTLELLRRDENERSALPLLSAYAVAPDDERARFSFVLSPSNPVPWPTPNAAWQPSLISEDGATVSAATEEFGELISNLPANYLDSIEPDSSSELMLTRAYLDAETNGVMRRPQLSLSIISAARGGIGGPQATTTVGIGTTNWAAALSYTHGGTPRPAPRPDDAHGQTSSP